MGLQAAVWAALGIAAVLASAQTAYAQETPTPAPTRFELLYAEAVVDDNLGPVVLAVYAIEGPPAILQRRAGAIARLEDDDGAVFGSTAPDTGSWALGLVAFFPGSDVSEGDHLHVRLIESPAVATTPASSERDVVWRDDALADMLLFQLRELDEEETAHSPFVEGGLITATGAALVASAAPVLVEALPAIYASALEGKGREHEVIPAQTGRVGEGDQDSAAKNDLMALGRVASLNDTAVGLLVWALLCGGLGFVAYHTSNRRSVTPALMLAVPAGWWVSSLGIWPPAYILGPFAILVVVAAARTIQKIWPRG